MLVLRNIKKSYASAESGRMIDVLQIEELVVQPNEKIALIGPSGSGKSTLLNIIAGIVRPTSGSIYLHGQELTNFNEKKWDAIRTHQLGYIFQSFYLLPGFSALENVMIAMQFAGTLRGKAREERAKELLHKVGLATRIHHKPHQLSNGEQQRVAIARALANQPVVMLADEPTANLDASTALMIIELLVRVCDEQQIALLLSTHDRDLIRYTDRTVQLIGGRYTAVDMRGTTGDQKQAMIRSGDQDYVIS